MNSGGLGTRLTQKQGKLVRDMRREPEQTVTGEAEKEEGSAQRASDKD